MTTNGNMPIEGTKTHPCIATIIMDPAMWSLANPGPWPTNKYGTSWRQASMIFDWQDEGVVEEAIETVNPLKITVRCRPVAAIGFETVADMVMHFLADKLPPGRRFDNEGMYAVIDPCTDTEALQALVEEEMDEVEFSIFGMATLDLADQETHRLLIKALADRHGQFVGKMPVIDF
jgi:hypothetical protein